MATKTNKPVLMRLIFEVHAKHSECGRCREPYFRLWLAYVSCALSLIIVLNVEVD